MPAWTTEEEVVVLFYASRGIKNATIAELIAKKCYPRVRNLKQITHKSSRLRTISNHGRLVVGSSSPTSDEDWTRKLADQWIVSKMEKAKLEQLLEFDGETAAIIAEASGLGQLSARFYMLTT